jgi:hypothetical protein
MLKRAVLGNATSANATLGTHHREQLEFGDEVSAEAVAAVGTDAVGLIDSIRHHILFRVLSHLIA